MTDIRTLLTEKSDPELKQMVTEATRLTTQFFGRTIKMYAPLYLSNYCTNACVYCGFRIGNKYSKKLLTLDEIKKEAEILIDAGMQEILLVAGDDPEKITVDYVGDAVSALKEMVPSVTIETASFSKDDYRKLVDAGLDGVTLYQETYDRELYKKLHPKGGKADYDFRYDNMYRAGRAGVRKLGMGILLGLAEWRTDFAQLLNHARDVEKQCWKSSVSVSFPRIRHSMSGFKPEYPITDRDLLQAVCAARLAMPQTDLVLSTRENSGMRDNLLGIGITKISAGSKTAPGAYTVCEDQGEQFAVSDDRTIGEVAEMLLEKGFQPVWKDWEACMK